MKEKLYTIPVNDAFDTDCECPVCAMRQVLENNAVEYTLGPSYMEDDVRMETDRVGFCREHMRMLNLQKNRLGLALIMKTHIDRTNREIRKLAETPSKAAKMFKKGQPGPVAEYIDTLNHSCFICDRIENTFYRYIPTIVFLWKTETEFRKKYQECKGFCTEHYGLLVKEAPRHLKENELTEFMEETTRLYLDNMQRLADDLEWFADKFDYRHQNDPWKNSKDAIPRGIVKTNGILEEVREKENN